MQADRETFGPRLRSERERRGITLKTIAESTKIKESLFAELERSDLSKWPQGIFRRAHLCAYVSAIGLPQQPTLTDFLRLFPDEDSVEQATEEPATSSDDAVSPRSAELVKPVGPEWRFIDCAWVVLFDLAAVFLISSILAGVGGMSSLTHGCFCLPGLLGCRQRLLRTKYRHLHAAPNSRLPAVSQRNPIRIQAPRSRPRGAPGRVAAKAQHASARAAAGTRGSTAQGLRLVREHLHEQIAERLWDLRVTWSPAGTHMTSPFPR